MRTNELLRDNVNHLTPPDVELAASILDVLVAAAVDGIVRLVVDVGRGIVNMVNILLEVDFAVLEKAGPACLRLVSYYQFHLVFPRYVLSASCLQTVTANALYCHLLMLSFSAKSP